MSASRCYSCGKVVSGPRIVAWTVSEDDDVQRCFVGPDCFRRAQKAGPAGHWNEKTDATIWDTLISWGRHPAPGVRREE